MATNTHWLEYGEPIDGEQKVEAVHRITYNTGPNESREDDVTEGTLTFDGLERGWGGQHDEHIHDDGSLPLSALDAEDHDRIMAEFEADE